MYNLIFAKNQMCYDEIKVAMLCHLLWKLLEFDPEEENKDTNAMFKGDEEDDEFTF